MGAVSLTPDARIERTADDEIALVCARGRIVMRRAGPGYRLAMERLAETACDLAVVAAQAGALDGEAAGARVVQQVGRLRELRLAGTAVALGGERAIVQTDGVSADEVAAPSGAVRLSRFAYVRRVGDSLALETPRSGRRTYLTAVAAALAATLAAPRTAADLARALGSTVAQADEVLALLAAAGLLEAADAPEPPELEGWEFHDLLFHAATRGRHHGRVGGTFRFAGRVAPLPVLRPPGPGERVALPSPAPDAAGPDLYLSLDRRRSARALGDAPVALADLGALLYRSARVLGTERPQPERLPDFVVSLRPYPGGGGVHPLEVYPVVDRCDGLAAGLYRYDPGEHALERVATAPERVAALLEGARATFGGAVRPAVLLVLAARFARASWKYEGLAYALLLKEVGALMQTVQLTADALGLASCPLGFGDADLFAAAAGTAYAAETSVGEILIGARADADGQAAQ